MLAARERKGDVRVERVRVDDIERLLVYLVHPESTVESSEGREGGADPGSRHRRRGVLDNILVGTEWDGTEQDEEE
jgi:hypothetical protein